MIIAIDGPAGAGKSTVARGLARRLGFRFLDTGAMYRAVTLSVLERGFHPSDADACARVARELELDFDPEGCVLIDGKPGEPDIRSRTVTLNVSAVSAHPEVRAAIMEIQRRVGRRPPGTVAEGRDTTTVVFPEAELKFFLDASVENRAWRRAEQEDRAAEIEVIRADIERRDRLDTTRAHAPLRRAPDAISVDADASTADEVVERLLAHVVTVRPGGTGGGDGP